MRIQFMCKGNKILYCDDEIIRITQERTLFKDKEVKETNVSNFSKAIMLNETSLRLYDLHGELWGEVNFNKQYAERVEKIIQKITTESKNVNGSRKNEQKILSSKDLEFRKFLTTHGIHYEEYENMHEVEKEKIVNNFETEMKTRNLKTIGEGLQGCGCSIMLFPILLFSLLFLFLLVFTLIKSLF